MAESDAPILPLPPEVAKKVQSSVLVTNLNAVVVELVKNSLDAGAESIKVVIDHRRGGCVVEDDGFGLPTAEFKDGSGLCRAHNTSKANRQSVSSCKGSFLAALATMSLLTISSRHRGQSKTNTVIFHESKVISRLVPAPTHQEIQGSQGTRITVNNLFGNMPVRVKYRASALRRNEDVDKEWEELRRMLVALALSNVHLHKLRLSDRNRARTLTIRAPAMQSGMVGFAMSRLQTIFAQSGLVSSAGTTEWVNMSASTPDLSVEAYVALSSSPTKLNQFISLGINPLFNENGGANVLYNEINQVFAASDFGYIETSCENEKVPISTEGRGVKNNETVKGPKRWPMFYLRVDIQQTWEAFPKDGTDVHSDRTLQHIIDIVHAMFYQFLQQHHYRPRKRRKTAGEAQSTSRHSDNTLTSSNTTLQRHETPAPTPSLLAKNRIEAFDSRVKIPVSSKKQCSHYFNNFTNWSRVKGGDNRAIQDLLTSRPKALRDAESVASASNIGGTSSSLLNSSPTSTRDDNTLLMRTHHATRTKQEIADELIEWVDPGTRSVVLVSSRTGQCSTGNPGHGRSSSSTSIARPHSTGSLISRHKGESIKRPQTAPGRGQSVWFENIISHCNNPVFSCPERPIRSIGTHTMFDSCFDSHDTYETGHHSLDPAEESIFNIKSGKLSRMDLADTVVVAQVDRKFILVRTTKAEEGRSHDGKVNKMLVLVDQHAADERCRLEQMLSEMFIIEDFNRITIRVHQLTTAIQYPIQGDDVALFEAYSKYFRSWGCHYEIRKELVDTERRHSILIEALPLLIVERCRLEPKLFVDILRKEIWSNAGERVPPIRNPTASTAKTKDHPFPWLRWIAGCPEGIMELINSRACRSSIMFNDLLPINECQSLISRLSHCAFPFQCAHGRPTMIPIVDEGRHHSKFIAQSDDRPKDETIRLRDDDREKESFVEAFRNWHCK